MSFEAKKITGSSCMPTTEAAECFVASQKKVYVFGGRSKDKRVTNDLHVFNSSGLMSWDKLSPTGVAPPARCGHTTTLIDNKLFVYGGSPNDTAQPFDDVYTLNTSTLLSVSVVALSSLDY